MPAAGLARRTGDIPFLSGLLDARSSIESCVDRRAPAYEQLRHWETRATARQGNHVDQDEYANRSASKDSQSFRYGGLPHSTIIFRTLTAMSPLQYQKQIRLQAARARMLADDVDAATVAFEVGYESASQFNREYSRLFGQPPMRDVAEPTSPGTPRFESIATVEPGA